MQLRIPPMILRLISNPALGVLLIFVLQTGSAHAQSSSSQDTVPKSYPVISRETYNRVLEILFPRDDPDSSKTVFELVLRFRPSFQPTSQIVIRKRVDKVEIVEYTSLEGNIYRKLNEALASGSKEDAVELAKLIRVQRKEIRIPHDQIQQWYADFLDSLSETTTLKERGEEFDKTEGSETILLDGTIYDLWYQQRLNKMKFSLYDVEVDTPGSDGEFKLVKWMNALRREVGRLSDNAREATAKPRERW